MSVAVAPAGWLSNRRNIALALLFAIAVSLAMAIGVYNRGGLLSAGDSGLGDAARNALNQGVNGVNAMGNTVASLLGMRSPGERADGTLANMKQRKQPALYQRALPKVRGGPQAPAVGAAPVPPAAPIEAAPLYNVVTDTPKGVLPGAPVGFASPGGGPLLFPGFSPPGGGGGVVVPPVTTSPPETPGTPIIPTTPTAPTTPTTPTPPVPEPASWLMMLLGFMLIGRVIRHDRSASLLPT